MPTAYRQPPPPDVAWTSLCRRTPIVAALIATAAVLITALTWQVTSGISAMDTAVLDWMIAHRGEPLTGIATVITDLGDTLSMTILAALTVGWFALRRNLPVAALVAVTSLGAGVLVWVIKRLVGRHRPPETSRLVFEPSLSYPSGHTLGSTVVVGIVAIVLVPQITKHWLRTAATVLAVAFPVAVGLSRIYLGVHWTTDVLAGWIIGLLWLVLCVTVFTRVLCPQPTAITTLPNDAPESR
ncbi:phosphatase PAP2 family protein [Nocardia sp. NPDC058518]|uniref:phosphatase PAP2 family protein n=1 Tax=Nocardia sp. NPDC058518 TaxID=3346534 RepID=UPI003669D003